MPGGIVAAAALYLIGANPAEQLAARFDVELRVEILDVRPRRFDRHAELAGDLLGRVAVRQAKQPMKEVFAQDKDLPVTEAGPFSWLTRPNVPVSMMQQPPQIQYPDVPGVLNAGEEFMETTFALEAGEVGVAFNHPQSIVFVIQPALF